MSELSIEIKKYNINSFFLGEVTKEPQINIDSTNFGLVENFRKISDNVINL